MHSMTSAMSHSAAVRTEFIRFSAASDESRSDDRWLPTSTIGTGEFCTMKPNSFFVVRDDRTHQRGLPSARLVN
jgi:hypothetical protein